MFEARTSQSASSRELPILDSRLSKQLVRLVSRRGGLRASHLSTTVQLCQRWSQPKTLCGTTIFLLDSAAPGCASLSKRRKEWRSSRGEFRSRHCGRPCCLRLTVEHAEDGSTATSQSKQWWTVRAGDLMHSGANRKPDSRWRSGIRLAPARASG